MSPNANQLTFTEQEPTYNITSPQMLNSVAAGLAGWVAGPFFIIPLVGVIGRTWGGICDFEALIIFAFVGGTTLSGFIAQGNPWSYVFWWTLGPISASILLVFCFLGNTTFDRDSLSALAQYLAPPIPTGSYGFEPFQVACFTFSAWAGIIAAQIWGLLFQRHHAAVRPLSICRCAGGTSWECFLQHPVEASVSLNAYRVSFGLMSVFVVTDWQETMGVGWMYGLGAFLNVLVDMIMVGIIWKGHIVREWTVGPDLSITNTEDEDRVFTQAEIGT
ncbi:hypothetical protein Q7P35_009009 [Cladosporium inversicolor]